ncbi:hypothetical protein HDU67_006949 [Dinochytrium kinnereticum]|nr:hypothetical protein HDU67_006949 [Dinochytrium kinnereticum]
MHRTVTSFGVLGTSLFDAGRAVAGLVYWQAPLEKWLCGEGDVVREGRVVRRGVNRKRGDGTRKSIVQWLLTENRFTRVLGVSSAIITAIEFALYRDPQPVGMDGAYPSGILVLFPYSLYPLLEHTIRWLWALTDQDQDVKLFGVLPINPVYLPIVMTAFGGFSAWKEMLKGFLVAVATSHLFKIRRGGEEGELVPSYLIRLGKSWQQWGQRLVRRGRGGGSAPNAMPGSFPEAGVPDLAQFNAAVATASGMISRAVRELGVVGQGDSVPRRRAPVAGGSGGRGESEVQMEEVGGYTVEGSWGPGRPLGS